jgi:Cu(I)/Ag(I) efflux system membrane protein CusA/SilA
MAAPVMGGVLVADEVIDLLLPVLFYRVRRARWLRLHHSAGVTPQGLDGEATPSPANGDAPRDLRAGAGRPTY